MDLALKILDTNDFDYGYVTTLPSNFNPILESRKIKGLFFHGHEEKTEQRNWLEKRILILDGSIKNILKYNFLNAKQIEKISSFLEINTFKVSDKLSLWTVDSKSSKHFKHQLEDIILQKK